jgi:hypothetical protein
MMIFLAMNSILLAPWSKMGLGISLRQEVYEMLHENIMSTSME